MFSLILLLIQGIKRVPHPGSPPESEDLVPEHFPGGHLDPLERSPLSRTVLQPHVLHVHLIELPGNKPCSGQMNEKSQAVADHPWILFLLIVTNKL